jgi:hypothetical protein
MLSTNKFYALPDFEFFNIDFAIVAQTTGWAG